MSASTYPNGVREFARRLGEAGRRPTEIRASLMKRGYTPDLETVTRWADPEYNEARNLRRRRALNGHGQRRRRVGWEVRLARVRELRELGVSYRTIAVIVNHDLGADLTAGRVREIFRDRVAKETIERWLS